MTKYNNQPATPQTGSLRSHLIKGATGSFVLQVGFAGFAFLNAIVLARVLGAAGYGAFANAMAWVSLLTIPATFGFGILLVRDVAIYRSQEKWGLLKGLLRFSNRFVLGVSVLLALMAAAVAGVLFSATEQSTLRLTIWFALPLVPIFALYNLRESAIRGLEYVIRARLPSMLIRPGLLLAGIGVIYLFLLRYLSALSAMAVNVGAGLIALGMGIFWIRRLLPREVHAAKAEYVCHFWLKSAFPMLVYGGMQIVLGQTDIVMLGAIRGAEAVGLYAAASKVAYLLVYPIYASEVILAPVISRLFANSEVDRLQKILTRAVSISFLVALPIGCFFILTGDYILLLFGVKFISAKNALAILSVGRLFEVALGSSALVLGMTGRERTVAFFIGSASILNIILNAFLIPLFSIQGAAIASMISLLLAKGSMAIFALKKPRIATFILSTLGRIKEAA